MTVSEYTHLKHEVVLAVASKDNHSYLLQSLKELFKEGINSTRRFEKIRTIDQLLQVLELRDLLCEDNVNSLKKITQKLKGHEQTTLMSRINDYEQNHEPRECLNYYASEKANKSMSWGGMNNTTASAKERKKELILQAVANRIGSAWRDLARYLKVRECDIDDLDVKYDSFPVKAAKMLALFYEWADKDNWHFTLCEALDKARRKQLRMIVQEIMMKNI